MHWKVLSIKKETVKSAPTGADDNNNDDVRQIVSKSTYNYSDTVPSDRYHSIDMSLDGTKENITIIKQDEYRMLVKA